MADEYFSSEAVMARATASRGDIFPEWKVLAHELPRTYDLVTTTGGYFHKYEHQGTSDQVLSGPMRELIAVPALCAKGDTRRAPNHVRRMYRMGLTDRVILEAASAAATVYGWQTMASVALAIQQACDPGYGYGELPQGGAPESLRRFRELECGRDRVRPPSEAASLGATPEWRYAAEIDPELAERATAFVDHCLLVDDGHDALLGPGPRHLIVIAALCTRGEAELAARHIRIAYDYGMTPREVLEAISCVMNMYGMVTGTIGLRAMHLADGPSGS
jgi:alkylhydroperoxidase/carboxymuconolactone decarboxylase family protein YurZ